MGISNMHFYTEKEEKCTSLQMNRQNSRQLFSTTFYLNEESPAAPEAHRCSSLLQLLLGTQVVGVAALLLAAVDGTWVQTGVTPEREHHHHQHRTYIRGWALDFTSEACALTCGRSSSRSCISGPAVWGTARWCLLWDAAPGGGWTLRTNTNTIQ